MSDHLLLGVILIAVGFVLAFLEIFIPSMGLIAAVAGLTALAGVVALFFEGPAWGFTGLGTVVFGGIAMVIFGVRLLPYTPFGKGLLLGESEEELDRRNAEAAERARMEQALVGVEGVAQTDLRPVGTALVEGAQIEVLSRGAPIDAGTAVKVVEVRGNEIFVKPLG